MEYLDELAYILLHPDEDYGIRGAAILTLLTDVVTTLFLLFYSGLPVTEFNPLGSFLLSGEFLGTTLFMSIPLFTLLILIYLPGILGNAVAMTSFIVHAFATLINLSHAAGTPLEYYLGVTAYQAYVFAIITSALFSFFWYLPRLRDRAHEFREDRPDPVV
ncbi:MAG: hypothetical protein SVU32_02755 [Candidatus Nanohaloarchaea archaeon]|nr:hypothetical protein [Candidatus Nanohaloarchaea archaeon]